MIDDGIPNTISEFPNAKEELSAALEAFKIGMERSLGVCFPACVYSYDRFTHTATVMPLVKMAYFDGEYHYIRRKPYKVTVRDIQCGGVTIDFPVYVGDTGWVISSDRDTTLLKQEGALTTSVLEGSRALAIVEDDYQAKPYQPLLHSFTSGFFIPDNWGQWENWRYKDNPAAALGAAVYIGTSFDTMEDRPDTSGKIYQKGTAYEGRASSSLVVQKNGAISMASSSSKSEGKRSRVESGDGRVRMIAEDDVSKMSGHIILDAKEGISIRQDNEGGGFVTVCNIKPDTTSFIMSGSGGETVQILIEGGKINISTSNEINVSAGGMNIKTNGKLNVASTSDVNVNALGNATVTTQGNATISATSEARVNAGGNVNVSTGGDANVSAAKNANISVGKDVNISASDKVNLVSKTAVNLVTAGDTTILSKKKGTRILVSTQSKQSEINVVAEGEQSNVAVTLKEQKSSLSFTTEQKESSITVKTLEKSSPITVQTLEKSSPINILSGEESDISITAGQNSNIAVSANNNVNVSSAKGTVSISAAQALNLSGGKASLTLENNTATINSKSLKFLSKDIYLEDKGTNVKYTQ